MGQNDEGLFRKLIVDGQITRSTFAEFGIGGLANRRDRTHSRGR